MSISRIVLQCWTNRRYTATKLDSSIVSCLTPPTASQPTTNQRPCDVDAAFIDDDIKHQAAGVVWRRVVVMYRRRAGDVDDSAPPGRPDGRRLDSAGDLHLPPACPGTANTQPDRQTDRHTQSGRLLPPERG